MGPIRGAFAHRSPLSEQRLPASAMGILTPMDQAAERPDHHVPAVISSWLPAIAWACLIFAFSAQPNLRFMPDEGLDFVVRKAGHMAVFGILAELLGRGLSRSTGWRRRWVGLGALALAALYAVSDEVHQAFVDGRHPSANDVGIDVAGALIALLVLGAVRSRRA